MKQNEKKKQNEIFFNEQQNQNIYHSANIFALLYLALSLLLPPSRHISCLKQKILYITLVIKLW